MSNAEIVTLVLIVAAFLGLDALMRLKKKQSIFKSFHIGGTYIKDSGKFFSIAQFSLFIAFVAGLFYVADNGLSPSHLSLVTFTYLFFISCVDSVEQWIYKKEEKEYQHMWLAASFSVVFFLFILARV
ncbi:DUF4181 domain-containing protein [Jeotgalibacillus proteolyticus]|uniref:DUF4181 domain-containing protein n=1 Tax=Jeotgalibacillus proteolyticus TaxID=2082395 RepID=A0A2S5GFN0_9BACL|nr:DUF4181 domain-containing protein [Jeotgalibacillus proteolyticus]PPA71693.1 hypothetical protein C4B60_06465 [Jeotgalibacillus proteolyticus]